MQKPIERRQLLGGGALALAGLSGGAVVGTSGVASAATVPIPTPSGKSQSISFGWEVDDLHDNGADVSFEILEDMVLIAANVEVATVLISLPSTAGFQEVLCQAAISRQAPPAYGPAPTAYLPSPITADFGKVAFYNPSNIVTVSDSAPLQDKFVSIILKSWVPLDGTASSASRHVHTEPNMAVQQGDYLMFHMDHSGVEVKGEMQVVLTYELGGGG
jgi:hypothetical protein